jgi:rare lipoprotein A
MNAMPRHISFIVVLVILLPLLSHCGGRGARHGEPLRGSWSSSSPSSSKGMPATQRPYTIDGVTYCPIPSAKGFSEQGIASWYGPGFHGRKTSNGETYNMYDMTAAHKTLPMDTRLLVQNLDNGAQTVVRINDRGPFIDGRIIDLSHSAARTLGIIEHGTARVKIAALDGDNPAPLRQQTAVAVPASAPTGKPTQTTARRVASQTASQPAPAASRQDYFVQIDSFSEQQPARRLQERFAT